MISTPRIFLGLGECMVELAPTSDGTLRQGFAGDVFNTLWYSAQALGAGWQVRFQTALGIDSLSEEMIAFAQKSGIDCSTVPRLPGTMPGLYMIRLTDGERSFLYWRGQSAARRMMDDADLVATEMTRAAVIYLSGITLAILPPEARAALVALMAQARDIGALVVFDPNIRPALWDSADTMRIVLSQAAAAASLVLPSHDDEASAFGDASPEQTASRYHDAGTPIVVVKNGPAPVLTQSEQGVSSYDTPPLAGPLIDSTAAGDSFNAGFLAEFLRSSDIGMAVRAGQRLAASVVQGRGALVALRHRKATA